MYERRSVPAADILDCGFEDGIAGKHVGSIYLGKMEIRKVLHQLADIAAGGVYLHRNRYRVFVVFNHEQDRQLQV